MLTNALIELEKFYSLPLTNHFTGKAKCIVDAEPATSALRNAIVVLSGFHTRMSFLRAIGFFMADSGL